MRKVAGIGLLYLLAAPAFAQVDVEHRRVLSAQTGIGVVRSEETPSAFGYFWFNENHYPWTNSALRVFFAGVYASSELSCFLPANTNVAVGVGLGGGGYVNSVTAYVHGERLDQHSLYGDTVEGHVFLNETIPNPTPLPLNLRATYGVSGSFYRSVSDDPGLVVPASFLTQTMLAEFRFGGVEPGLLARRGVELYLAADANYRTGNDSTIIDHSTSVPTVVALTPSSYQRVYGSLTGKAPIGPSTIYGRVGGGWSEHLDELSAWKLGGNLTGIEPFNYTLHGYYTREILAEDFVLANVALSQQLTERYRLAVHLYGDYAAAKTITPFVPGPRDWHSFLGVGAGVSCRAFWNTDMLLSYGYGVNAARKGETGGHEIGLALEKKF